TWCYIIGEFAGYYLNFFQASTALTAGCMIGMLLAFLAAGPICARFGIDSIASTKPQFGARGWVIPAAMQLISIVGWNSLLLIFGAKSATQLMITLGVMPAGMGARELVPASTLIVCALIYLTLLRGATGVTKMSNILVAHVPIGCWMLYLLITRRWPELRLAQPVLAGPDKLWNYTTGVEIGITATMSWWPYIGAMIRMAPNARTVVVPVMLGMGAATALLSLIGIAGILVLKSSDPSEWLRSVGGPTYAIIALVFVSAANFGTAITGIYSSAIGLRNFAAVERMSWSTLLLITIAPVALVGALIPELFFARFGAFLAFLGVAFAPLCGIQIADYFLLRRRVIDIRAIYGRDPAKPYRSIGGFNPAALLALGLGCAIYLKLLNPLTYASSGPYRFLTASLPAATCAAGCYLIVTRLIGTRSADS
ncbi:MAG TPA: cytosine permease, partial [Steroidobacteraceae bacterium]|nr:cytosine permease [Steroidobacteraceae bacterium]